MEAEWLTDTTQRVAAEAGPGLGGASALPLDLACPFHPYPWALQRPDPLPESRLLTDASLPGCGFEASSQGASPGSGSPGTSAAAPALGQEPGFIW